MRKIRLLLLLFFACIAAITGRLFIIQVVESDKFAVNNTLRSVQIAPMRGNILDTKGNPLVVNQIRYKLFCDPQKIEDKDKFVKTVDQILNIGEATLEAKIKTNKLWIPLAADLTKEKKDLLERADLGNIGFEQEQKRFYPDGSSSAHMLGFLGKNERGENVGYFGLEGFYNRDLSGLPGIVKTERDLFGNPIFFGIQQKFESENGRDLMLTIDAYVQNLSKQKLKEGMERYKAAGGCIIVADPNNMQILALTCLPDYDPAAYWQYSENYFKNPAVSVLFEPGSIFKPLIVAAALDQGVIEPTDSFVESGPIKIGGYQVTTWDDNYDGEVSITRILEKSSNVGMVYIGQQMGKENIIKYFKKFGFYEKTGIDLQGEIRSLIKPSEKWYPIDVATSTFGQGLAISRMQMLQSFAAIINGGHLYRPYLVKQIKSYNGQIKNIEPKKIRQAVSTRTSATIRKMLERAVQYGEIKWETPEGYRIGGKTGTAQIPIEGHYDPTKTVASFIGFAPADKPKLLILVSYDRPGTSPWGSETAAPIFFELISNLFIYYNIPPDDV